MNTASGRHSRTTASLTLVLAMVATATSLQAQRQGPRGGTARSAATVERAIRLADELELGTDQKAQLEAIRTELLEQRTAQTAALLALRSEVAAGMREPEAVRAEMAERWTSARAARESLQDRLGEILTDEQQAELQRMNRRAMWRLRGMRDRSQIEGRRGARGGRAFDRGRGRAGSRGRGR